MLIYHPAFDAYHCVFRFISLIEACTQLEVEKACILDFYLVFPASIASIRLPQELTSIRSTARRLENPYHDPFNAKRVFKDMRGIQEEALRCLAAANFIDADRFEGGVMHRTQRIISEDLKNTTTEFIRRGGETRQFVLQHLSKINLSGPDGLKARTGLLEFRYDPV